MKPNKTLLYLALSMLCLKANICNAGFGDQLIGDAIGVLFTEFSSSSSARLSQSSTNQTDTKDSSELALKHFVETNLSLIQKEAAMGGGEYITTLAELLKQQDADAFAQWMQNHYDQLFLDSPSPNQFLKRLQRYM